MRRLVKILALFGGSALLVALLAVAYFLGTGVSARSTPGSLEASVARTIRGLAIRSRLRGVKNPVPVSDEVIVDGRDHFADHCASCHANDGSGNTEMGRGLYPKAPDMRLRATQDLPDAELFYIIENGVRLTGMPGWSTGTKEGETSSWHLVHFIRHLPQLSADEIERMERLNPKSPDEVRQEIEEQKFLQGGADAPPPPPTHKHTGAQK